MSTAEPFFLAWRCRRGHRLGGRSRPGGPAGVPRPGGVELDVHGEQVGAEHAHVDRVQRAQRVPGDDAPLARERVIVGADGGDAGHPAVAQPGAQPDPDVGVVLDVAQTTLAHVAEESGWSIRAIRYYFPDKDELVGSALWRVGERVDERIRHRTAGGMTLNDLRIAATELLPLDPDGREMALVYLAFLAQAAVVPALADAAEGAAQRLQEPLAARIAHLVQAGELPAHLDADYEAARLRVLLDGLRLQLITTPRQTSASWALAVLDDHFTALTAPPAASRHPDNSRTQRR